MEPNTPEKDPRSKLVDEILSTGKRAFNPSSDAASRTAAQEEFQKLIDGNGSWNLLPVLNALIKPKIAPEWLRPELMKILTLVPLRPDGVRGTMEFIFSVHPSSTLKASEAATPQKRGANITQEAMAVVTRILTSPPATVPPEDWFSKVAPQLIVLLDGNEGAELSVAAAQIIMFGVLGTPGWNVFVEPLLRNLDPSRKSNNVALHIKTEETEIVDLSEKAVLVTADDLFITLRRMSSMINSTPYPAQTKRMLDPVLAQLWAISCQSKGNKRTEDRYSKPSRSLLHTFLKLSVSVSKLHEVVENLLYQGEYTKIPQWRYQSNSDGDLQICAIRLGQGSQAPELDWTEIQTRSEALIRLLTASCTPEETSTFFLDLLGRWFQSTVTTQKPEILTKAEDSQDQGDIKQLLEITILQKMLEQIPDKLISRVTQVTELVAQILDPSGLQDQSDDIIAVALSLFNLVITAPSFKKSNLKTEVLQALETSLAKLGAAGRPEVSPTAKNLTLLLRYREAIDPAEEGAFVPTDKQIEDRRTYKLALEYITQADNPPPIRSEGINLISGLVASDSSVLDVQATLVLLSSLLQDSEDFINLRVVKLLTQLANKHPKATTQEILEHYLDSKEISSTDVRLRFGEALVQVIERLGETFAGDVARRVSETLLSIAGRRGHRPKTEAKQSREKRLQDMKKKQAEDAWGGDVPDLSDDLTEEELAKNEILTQIVEGWESKRGSEDVRMRASALSIFSVGLETNIAGIGPDLVSIAVDLCINVLALEREIEKGIIRRAAILAVLGFVKALDAAKQSAKNPIEGFNEARASTLPTSRSSRHTAIMAPARIIADSDDSDDDFESPNSPSKPTTTSAIPSQGRSSDPVSVATNSTDPKFFQAIYTEQQRAAVASDTLRKPDESSLSNGAAPSSIPAMPVADRPQLERNDTGTSSLTSASDLITGLDSAEEREPEVVDLTEVTASPKMTVAHATPDDMWDVPSSPVGDSRAPLASLAKSRTSTSGTKRKRVNNVEFTSPVAIDMPSQGSTQPFDTTPAAARMENGKRAKLRNPDSSLPAEEDDVDMVVVPHAAAVPSFGDLVSGQKPVSMYIVSQTLSASQKLEYEYHSVGPSPEDPGPTPTQPFSTMQAAARSSGATTIAYSTPSQTRAIGLPPAHAESHVTLDTVQEQTQQGFGASVDPEATIEIQSSPDIISAASVRRKRRNVRDEPPQTTESHREDEGWDSDDIGFHRESYKPRVSRRRGSDSSRQDEAEMPGKIEIPVADMGPAAQLPLEEPASLKEPASTSTTKPKKRGRPRKSDTAISESPAPAETSTMPQITDTSETVKDAAAGTEAATAATPTTTKKKRGRPKKADNNASESVQQATEKPHAPEVEHAGDAPSGKAAKRSKGRGEHVDAQQQEGCTADAGSGPREQGGSDRVLQPVTPNAALSKSGSDGLGPQKSAAAEGKGAATKETPAQADGDKSGTSGKTEGKQRLSTPASLSATKPIYRVGLSKRSRIAPLLKSLKK
ncbi:hypothetical protein CTAM01_02139 [Colletotrichum tamarilloi]|uniref:RNA polymerase II assembly factor Rtp1 C-terminal domain-containing protein n=1 Tax=Colletotrichum tamarilloi TaxID=1209934 RepID=A0ABQ9RNL1_9PEZI|nr:uncharacterized protein CTAM01_02139 [Colletotrichum tamarilloi]KAK1508353.1 hypothetical protein CTAM01_02139 [Colletotrichum tamarilloi]